MENKEFAKLLEERTKKFAVQIIKLSSSFPEKIEIRVVRNQLVKSATSIGANYREANRSKSKADFRNKIRICEGEASETSYWLEIVENFDWCNKESLRVNLKESNELLALFTSISNKLRT